MGDFEAIEVILDFLLKNTSASASQLKHDIPLFRNFDPARINLLIEDMKKRAAKYFDLKYANDRPVLIKNQYTHLLKEDEALQKILNQRKALLPLQIAAADPLANLHPRVHEVASELFQNGHYRQAILDTYIALDNAVQDKSGLNRTGMALMDSVFSSTNPILKISNDPDERMGFMFLFKGAIGAIRNPKAHRVSKQNDPQRTLEWLSFASVLFRIIDDSQLKTNVNTQHKEQSDNTGR